MVLMVFTRKEGFYLVSEESLWLGEEGEEREPQRALLYTEGIYVDRDKAEMQLRDFSGGPVVKTLHFHCRGCGFDPWSGKMPHGMAKKLKKDSWGKQRCGGE